MSNGETWNRVAGRVILVDGEDRVLLFEGFDPDHPEAPWWFTPGGGVEPGESAREAAARELAEETGLVVDPASLGDEVFQNYVEFVFNGTQIRQYNHFFTLRAPSPTFEISTAGFDEMEQRTHLGYRWWSAEELAQGGVTYYPVELATLLKQLRGE
jgi:8-oxo-dGTP pyrophosphatase MutT (NUDIX family)